MRELGREVVNQLIFRGEIPEEYRNLLEEIYKDLFKEKTGDKTFYSIFFHEKCCLDLERWKKEKKVEEINKFLTEKVLSFILAEKAKKLEKVMDIIAEEVKKAIEMGEEKYMEKAIEERKRINWDEVIPILTDYLQSFKEELFEEMKQLEKEVKVPLYPPEMLKEEKEIIKRIMNEMRNIEKEMGIEELAHINKGFDKAMNYLLKKADENGWEEMTVEVYPVNIYIPFLISESDGLYQTGVGKSGYLFRVIPSSPKREKNEFFFKIAKDGTNLYECSLESVREKYPEIFETPPRYRLTINREKLRRWLKEEEIIEEAVEKVFNKYQNQIKYKTDLTITDVQRYTELKNIIRDIDFLIDQLNSRNSSFLEKWKEVWVWDEIYNRGFFIPIPPIDEGGSNMVYYDVISKKIQSGEELIEWFPGNEVEWFTQVFRWWNEMNRHSEQLKAKKKTKKKLSP